MMDSAVVGVCEPDSFGVILIPGSTFVGGTICRADIVPSVSKFNSLVRDSRNGIVGVAGPANGQIGYLSCPLWIQDEAGAELKSHIPVVQGCFIAIIWLPQFADDRIQAVADSDGNGSVFKKNVKTLSIVGVNMKRFLAAT